MFLKSCHIGDRYEFIRKTVPCVWTCVGEGASSELRREHAAASSFTLHTSVNLVLCSCVCW